MSLVKLWIWFKAYGWMFGIAFVVGLMFVFSRKEDREAPIKLITEIKQRARADARAAELIADRGRDQALITIEHEYRATLEKLDEEQRREAVALRADPRKLARFLADHGGR